MNPLTSRPGRGWRTFLAVLLVAAPWADGLAQPGRRGGGERDPYDGYDITPPDFPRWKVDPKFENDVFTFARVHYNNANNGGGPGGGRRGGGRRGTAPNGPVDFFGGGGFGPGGGGGGTWATDVPYADLDLGLRLFEMTSLRVAPPPIPRAVHEVNLNAEELAKYPFIYIVEPGHNLAFPPAEARALRNYLFNGGFLMVDDFWGDAEWDHLYQQIKRVFPDREPVELEMTHPIFHSVFDLKIRPQVPGIGDGNNGYDYEPRKYYSEDHASHFYGIFDDKNRMMVLICRNTDFGDGWEREGKNYDYFKKFSEAQAYPMMINIIYYAMTH